MEDGESKAETKKKKERKTWEDGEWIQVLIGGKQNFSAYQYDATKKLN